MANDEFEVKNCFEEVAVLVPVCIAVCCILVFLALCFRYLWKKRRSGYVSFNNDTEAHSMGNHQQNEIAELTKRLEGNQSDITRLKSENEHDQREIEALKRELENVKRGKQEVELRLSEIMASQLRDGNPNIADLSDENRPTRLRDKFSELYDNAYTDVAADLEDKCAASYNSNDEFTKEMSVFMLDILMFAFKACTEKAQKQLLSLQQLILDPFNEVGLNKQDPLPETDLQLPKEFIVKLKDQRKTITPDLAFITNQVDSQLAGRYPGSPFERCLGNDSLRSYTKQCVEITWLMAIQDPPMYLNFNEERKQCLREYTQTGPTFDFLVWPSLYLNEGGSMMAKGVAQFRK